MCSTTRCLRVTVFYWANGDHIGEVTLGENPGAALQVIDNPLNPAYKLLVISGHNETELRQPPGVLPNRPCQTATLCK